MEVVEKGSVQYGFKYLQIDVTCNGARRGEENARRKVLPCGARLKVGLRDVFGFKLLGQELDYEKSPTIKCPICGALTWITTSQLTDDEHAFILNRTEEDVDNDTLRNEQED